MDVADQRERDIVNSQLPRSNSQTTWCFWELGVGIWALIRRRDYLLGVIETLSVVVSPGRTVTSVM